MPTENTTSNRGYTLPHADNELGFDVARVIAAFNAIDSDIAGMLVDIAIAASLDSPEFEGTPTAPTAPSGTDTSQLATTAFVKAAVDAISGSIGKFVDLKGEWDPSSGTFPGSGTAKAGHLWVVSGDGTVDGHVFNEGDSIFALVNNASINTFDANWHKSDNTDNIKNDAYGGGWENDTSAAPSRHQVYTKIEAILAAHYTKTQIDALVYNRTQTDALFVALLAANNTWSGTNRFTGSMYGSKGSDQASASTVTPPTDGNVFTITGTNTISAFGARPQGSVYFVRFLGSSLTLTNSSNFSLITGSNIVAKSGDEAIFTASNSSGSWRMLSFTRADGTALVSSGHSMTRTGSNESVAPAHNGGTISVENGSERTVTIQTQASGGYDDGHITFIERFGAGVLNVTAASGVELNGVDGGSCEIDAQYSGATIIRRESNEWTIHGSHGPVT